MARANDGERLPDLSQADWLSRPATQAVFAALTAHGAEARAVGGAVRNELMGTPVKDVDIATTALPADVMRLATQAGLHAVPTGFEHGTVTVVAQHVPFEVTTLRRDVETFDLELILADHELVERRIERLDKSAKRGLNPEEVRERELLAGVVLPALEAEKPLRELELELELLDRVGLERGLEAVERNRAGGITGIAHQPSGLLPGLLGEQIGAQADAALEEIALAATPGHDGT